MEWLAFRARALPVQAVLGEASEGAVEAHAEFNRGVALTARAPDSKSGGWGFESLHPCHHHARRSSAGCARASLSGGRFGRGAEPPAEGDIEEWNS